MEIFIVKNWPRFVQESLKVVGDDGTLRKLVQWDFYNESKYEYRITYGSPAPEYHHTLKTRRVE